MNRVKIWLKAFRLRTLPLSLSGILFGSALALEHGFWNTPVFVLALMTTLLFQILSNLANDLGDSLKGTDNEQRIGPARTVQAGEITLSQMKRAVVITALLGLISAALLIWISSSVLQPDQRIYYVLLAVGCILAAMGYTLGKNAYGYLGLGDLMVIIFFGLVSVGGVYPLYGGQLHAALWLPALAIGFLSAGVLNLNNMRDRENDAQSGKNTLVVRIGKNAARVYHLLLITAAIGLLITHLITGQHPAIMYLTLLPVIVLILHLIRVAKAKEEREFDPELKVVALSTFVFALLYIIIVTITQLWD